jgi:alkylhydroperoxidase family enzyme
MNTLNTAEKLFVHWTKETAPEASRPVLDHVEKVFGFVPNLMGTLAGAPAAAKNALIFEFTTGSLSPQEQQLVLLAASVENKGSYCTLAHSATAKAPVHVPAEVINAVRNREPVAAAKLNALISLRRELVRQRGYADPELAQAFIAAGYRKEQVMEILLGMAVKTISDYLDHTSPVEIDPAFWSGRAA